MTQYVVKASESFCFFGKKYAENVGDASDWYWLDDNEAEQSEVGATFTKLGEGDGGIDHREHVAADDGMQAAVGAQHFEDKNHNGIDDAVEGYNGPDTETVEFETDNRPLGFGGSVGQVSRLEVLDTQTELDTIRARIAAIVEATLTHPEFGKTVTMAIITTAPSDDGQGEVGGYFGNMPPIDAAEIAAERAFGG